MTVSATTTQSQAAGFFKDIHAALQDVRPSGIRLVGSYSKFDKKNKTGENYHENIWLTNEAGFSYQLAVNSTMALNQAIVSESKEVSLTGGQTALRSRVDAKSLFNATEKGKQAFGSMYGRLIANMKFAHDRRLEASGFHGGRSIAQLSAISGTSTTRTLTISPATWAPWIWTGGVNTWLDAYNSTTKLNDSATDGTEAVVVTAIDFANRQLSVTVESTDGTAMDSAGTSTELYFYGAYGKESTGFIGAASNSGTLYGISGATYELWAGNTVSVGSVNLTWAKIQEGIEAVAAKGCDEDLVLFVSLQSWSNLNRDLIGLRKIDAGYEVGKASVGHRAITFYSLTGMVEVVPTGFMKGGEALLLPKGKIKHVGSTMPTFKIPMSGEDEKWFKLVDDVMAVEIRSYADVAPYLSCPAFGCLYSGIVN